MGNNDNFIIFFSVVNISRFCSFSWSLLKFSLILRGCWSPRRQPGGEDSNGARAFTWSRDGRTGGHAGAHEPAANPSLADHRGPRLPLADPVSPSLMFENYTHDEARTSARVWYL